MASEQPLLTFIIPAYNGEQYLALCLDSLLHQTRMQHKIILVDDGSTDATGQIAAAYAAANPNLLRWIHQENRGLGAARNVGLALADTPYVTFLDCDDWQDCRFVEKLCLALERQPEQVDIVFTLPRIYDAVTCQVTPWRDQPLLDTLFYPDASEDSRVLNIHMEGGMDLYALEASACRRVYRRAFLQKIGFRFSEGVKWEDVQPHFHAIHTARRCIGLRETGFFYRVNTGGQITADSGKARLDIIPVFQSVLRMAETEKWEDLEIGYIVRTLWNFSSWSIGLANSRYIRPLLDALHRFYKTIPGRYFHLYYRRCATSVLRDRLLIAFLRSPFYRGLEDYRLRRKMKTAMEKLNVFKRMFGR